MSGNKEKIESDIEMASHKQAYKDPTETLPEAPPPPCHDTLCDSCDGCNVLQSWWSRFRIMVDDLLMKLNVHKCSRNKNKDGSQRKACPYRGCLDNIWVKCKAVSPDLLLDVLKLILRQAVLM